MDDGAEEVKKTGHIFTLIGLAASVAAAMAGGGLAVFAGITAIGCLGASLAATLAERRESDGERYSRECREAAINPATDEVAVSQGYQAEPGRNWRQSVADRKPAGCNR